jgi:hypothetical protein
MRDLFILAIHLLVTLVKLLRPGGVRVVAAKSSLLKHQLLISNRSRHRAPTLTTLDRVVLGLTTLFVSPRRIPKLGALVKPAMMVKVPQGTGRSQISSALFRPLPSPQARPQRSLGRTHRGDH